MKKITRLLAWILFLSIIIAPSARSQSFGSRRLILRQGDIPTIDGTNVPATPAYSGTVDTHVEENQPNTGYGASEFLSFSRYSNTVPRRATTTWIRFDNFTACLPAEAVIVQCRLYLTSAGDGVGIKNGGLIRASTAAWTNNMTWNTRVETGINVGNTMHYWWSHAWASNTTQWVDLTAIAQRWHSGAFTNNGIVLLGTGVTSQQRRERRLFSAEATATNSRPRLEIDFVERYWHKKGDGHLYQRQVMITNGADIIEDTYIRANTSNYATASSAPRMQTYNATETPERILLRIKTDDPLLQMFQKTGEDIHDRYVLQHAELLFNSGHPFNQQYEDLWRVNQSWNVNQVTFYTRDGTNAWQDVWPGSAGAMNNVVGGQHVGGDFHSGLMLKGATLHFDITASLQLIIDGSNNYGFVCGRTGSSYGAYASRIFLTEIAQEFLRPTLVLEVDYFPPASGIVIVIR